MARQLIVTVFNATHQVLEEAQPGLFDSVFPPEVDLLCPTPELAVPALSLGGYTLPPFKLAWPWLIPAALVGAFVGLKGGYHILSSGRPAPNGNFLWGLSHLWFAMMNLCAIGAHCVTEPHSPLWDEFMACDVAFTCSAALCGLLGFLAHMRKFEDTDSDSHGLILGGCGLAIMCASQLQGAGTRENLLIFEMMYLAAVAAAICLGTLRGLQLAKQTWGGSTARFVRGAFVWLALGWACTAGVPATMMGHAWLCSNAGPYYAQKVGVFPICFMLFNAMYAALTRYCLEASGDPSLLKPLESSAAPQLAQAAASSEPEPTEPPVSSEGAAVDDPARKKTQ